IHIGDGTLGWSEHAPFDAILVTAGTPELPRPLIGQLSSGGRLIIPLGDERSQVLKRFRRTASGLEEEGLGDCRFVKLLGRYGWPD
ncbi:MAG: protein-L-isoaspartate O-methyltransferase, partial [Candidatus Binatia bacterium]